MLVGVSTVVSVVDVVPVAETVPVVAPVSVVAIVLVISVCADACSVCLLAAPLLSTTGKLPVLKVTTSPAATQPVVPSLIVT